MFDTEKVLYRVHCANDDSHVFEKVVEVVKGSEADMSELDAYCPECDTLVKFEVEGKVAPDTDLYRKYRVSLD